MSRTVSPDRTFMTIDVDKLRYPMYGHVFGNIDGEFSSYRIKNEYMPREGDIVSSKGRSFEIRTVVSLGNKTYEGFAEESPAVDVDAITEKE